MLRIHSDFTGGNISVLDVTGDVVILDNQLRDTQEDWFYWAFCVENAQGRTLTFRMQQNRVGYFGPAVSHDLISWHWADSADGDSFTYTFGENEDKVYFAHDMLYHPAHFEAFAAQHGLTIAELCKGHKGKGRSVPCVTIGSGSRHVLLTARHHACESTGNYVLEGVLSYLIAHPLPDTTVFCVPFVDYDGVIDGDQGKSRAPYDHNRDYGADVNSIYPECAAIRAYAEAHGCVYGFDFHSPWHLGNENDRVFVVQKNPPKLPALNRFGELFEEECRAHPEALQYRHADDYPPDTGWNVGKTQCGALMTYRPENLLAFTLETAYFGTEGNKVSAERMRAMGQCFARALHAFAKEHDA